MTKGTAADLLCRNVTQGQLTALLLVKVMAAKAAGGESRFATNFMVLVKKRQWQALAVMASLLSNAGTALSPSDFRYAVPRDGVLLSLKICAALLVLAVLAAGTLWFSAGDGPQPFQAAGFASAAIAPPSDVLLRQTLSALLDGAKPRKRSSTPRRASVRITPGLLRAMDRRADERP